MAATFDEVLGRAPAGNRLARERTERLISQIVKDVEKESFALRLATTHAMSTYQERYRVSNTVPEAYWINGTTGAGDAPHGSSNTDDTNQFAKDSGLKQTTNMTWETKDIRPDEIAVQVPMPDSWRVDSDIAWGEVEEAVRTAFAKAIDAALFYGSSLTSHPLPSSFGDGLVPDAIAAGAVYQEGDGAVDLADSYAAFLQSFEQRGYKTTGVVVDNAETWRLLRLRTAGPEKAAIYYPPTQGTPASIYGRTLLEVDNGVFDAAQAVAIAADWSKVHVGIRQGITFDMSKTAVIHNAAGQVTYNAWQQDGQVLRAVMRLGYVVLDPYMHQTGQREFPVQVMTPPGS